MISSRYKANAKLHYIILYYRNWENITITKGRKCEKLKVKELKRLKWGWVIYVSLNTDNCIKYSKLKSTKTCELGDTWLGKNSF